MRIVQINSVYRYGSTGRSTMEMHEFLTNKSIDSYVFCANLKDEPHNIYRIGNFLDHKIHAFLSRLFGLQGYFSCLSTRMLSKKLDKISPDAVILGNIHSNFINFPYLLKYVAKKDIPTIVILHDCWFFTGHCCHYTEDKCDKWLSSCHDCPILNKYNNSWFFDNSHKIFEDKKRLFRSIPHLAVVGVSDWITDEAKKSILNSAKIIQRIYNWVDLSVFHPIDASDLRKKYQLDNSFVALCVSSGWDDKKGLSHIITLAKRLPEIKIVIIGILPNISLPDNIISVGPISDVQLLVKWYSLADVFLNLSLQETFGKVGAEALACGTPIIANDATAIPEVVGDCGVIIHDDNDEEIYEALNLMRSQDKRIYTNKCIERARNLFEKDKNLTQYLSLIKIFCKKVANES